MFLDDEIVQMVLDTKPDTLTEEQDRIFVNKIFQHCMDKHSRDVTEAMDDQAILPLAKKLCRLWDCAVDKLEKQGIIYLKKGGLKDLLKNHETLSKYYTEL